MPLGQVQLVRWSIPALALILGLLWYKRRRVDRVDPGGSSSSEPLTKPTRADSKTSLVINDQQSGDTSSIIKQHQQNNNSSKKHLCDSGINSDESLNTSGCSPPVQDPSPRKVSENLDIPGRASIQVAAATVAFSNPPWFEEEEDEDEEEVVEVVPEAKKQSLILSSQPAKNGCDLLSKSRSSAELIANGNAMKEIKSEQKRQQRQAKIVVANGTPQVHEFRAETPLKSVEDKQQQQSSVSGDEVKQQSIMVNGNGNTAGDIASDQPSTKQQQQSERDSANHSPVSAVLDGSVTDEARSEGSTDSGKGGSINGGQSKDDNIRTFYEFAVPWKLVGKLIGPGGSFLTQIRNNAKVRVIVKRHQTTDRNYRICSIDGTPENIAVALEMIRNHFPIEKYSYFTLEQIIYDEIIVPSEVSWLPELIQLTLVEGVNNDVFVCHIVTPNRLFIQLPTHPTFPSLRILTDRMTQEYDTVETPPVPEQLAKDMIFVAKFCDKWVRVVIVEPQGEQSLVRLVDHGGYYTLNNSEMRKIRADYLGLPFQAIEVFLSNIQPKDEEWIPEAYNIVSQLTTNSVGQAQIVGYDGGYNTYVNLYYNLPRQGFISVAEELIARCLAVRTPVLETVIPQEIIPAV